MPDEGAASQIGRLRMHIYGKTHLKARVHRVAFGTICAYKMVSCHPWVFPGGKEK